MCVVYFLVLLLIIYILPICASFISDVSTCHKTSEVCNTRISSSLGYQVLALETTILEMPGAIPEGTYRLTWLSNVSLVGEHFWSFWFQSWGISPHQDTRCQSQDVSPSLSVSPPLDASPSFGTHYQGLVKFYPYMYELASSV